MKHNFPWRRVTGLLLRAVRSNKFFWVLFGGFVLQALWIAFSGAYSMAFDEYFHYGIIKLYTHQWSPFFGANMPDAGGLGAISRDPSYLEHYLVSFPLRAFSHFFPAFMAQIVFLRVLDVAFFAAGVLVFRRVFRVAGLPRITSNIICFFLLALPVAPFMAAQVNYDDLLFLGTAVSILLALRVVQEIRDRDHIPVVLLLWLAAATLATSLVKYAFLPILLGIFIYIVLSIKREVGFRRLHLWPAVRRGAHGLRTFGGLAACVFVIVSAGLFVERYGVNTLRYHTPTPECDQVMDIDDCNNYDPFARNYSYKQQDLKDIVSVSDKLTYPLNWLQSMLRSLFFTVGPRQLGYPAGEPLPLAYVAGYVAGIGGLILLGWRLRWLWRQNHAWQLFIIVIIVYAGALFAQNLLDFLNLGVSVAIQGRYLMPVMPLALALVAVAAKDVLSRFRPRVTAVLLLVLVALMLEGGGFLPFVLLSTDAWMWQNPLSIHANQALRAALWPLVVR